MPRSSPQPAPEGADWLAEAGQALFRLGRALGRPPARRLLPERAGGHVELSRLLLVQVLAEAPDTVGAVAERLGIDPSTASRLVAEAVAEGLVERGSAPQDARRVPLALTEAGQALATDAAAYQKAVFEQVTGSWPERERKAFARHFVKFAAAVVAIRQDR